MPNAPSRARQPSGSYRARTRDPSALQAGTERLLLGRRQLLGDPRTVGLGRLDLGPELLEQLTYLVKSKESKTWPRIGWLSLFLVSVAVLGCNAPPGRMYDQRGEANTPAEGLMSAIVDRVVDRLQRARSSSE